jgi:hypothetical protein
MRYVLVNNRFKRSAYCTHCFIAITDGYVRELSTNLFYCDAVCLSTHVAIVDDLIEHRRIA